MFRRKHAGISPLGGWRKNKHAHRFLQSVLENIHTMKIEPGLIDYLFVLNRNESRRVSCTEKLRRNLKQIAFFKPKRPGATSTIKSSAIADWRSRQPDQRAFPL